MVDVDKRPDWVKCVLVGVHIGPGKGPLKETWCGRKDIHEWAFVDASHAAINARHEGYTVPCPECAKAISETLLNHAAAWDGIEEKPSEESSND